MPIDHDRPLGPDRTPFDAYQMAREKYVIDDTTGVLSRVGFLEQANAKISKSPHPENVAIIVLDLDRFKPINDTYGHPTGDLALRGTAEFLDEELRENDLVAHINGRYGGDEFIVFVDLTPREGSPKSKEERMATLVSRITDKYSAAMAKKNELFGRLSISAGGAFYEPGTPLEQTIKKADEQMYLNKGGAGREAS